MIDDCAQAQSQSNAPRHGVDGWELAEMEYDEATGLARFEYEQYFNELLVGQQIVIREQPYHHSHAGWNTTARTATPDTRERAERLARPRNRYQPRPLATFADN